MGAGEGAGPSRQSAAPWRGVDGQEAETSGVALSATRRADVRGRAAIAMRCLPACDLQPFLRGAVYACQPSATLFLLAL